MEVNLTSNQKCAESLVTSSDKSLAELRLPESLTYENAHGFISDVADQIKNGKKSITLDLSNVTLLDSSGIRALLQSKKLCSEANVLFELGSISRCVSRTLKMSGFAELFGINIPQISRTQITAEDYKELGKNGWRIYEDIAISNSSSIPVLRNRVVDAAIEAGASGDILCDIQIAAGEALTNAYRHGSPRKGINKIKMTVMSCQKAFVIEIKDEGDAFDPNSTTEPDPKKMRESGMGLYLMRQAMDIVEFETNCPGTRVRMIKWLRKEHNTIK